MGYLLYPEDERDLTRKLTGDFGRRLLLSDVAPQGEPLLASDPQGALPPQLPSEPDDPRFLMFWVEDLGPIRTAGNAAAVADPADEIARVLSAQSARAANVDPQDLIDQTRTPVLGLHRTRSHSGRLVPATLTAMPIPTSRQPTELLRRHRRVSEWLKRRGRRINPFEHCTDLPIEQPRNLNPFWVWVQPHAERWLEDGGEVWPWAG